MGQTIHEACRRGDLGAVRMLVAADPSVVDADDAQQWRPVFHAAIARHTGVVRFLIQSGVDLAAHEGKALHHAREVPGNQDVVWLLITHGVLDAYVRPPSDLHRQFLTALFLGDEHRVRGMQRLHPQLSTALDGRGDLPLHHAARQGDTGIVRALISGGADVNLRSERGETVLYCAGAHGYVDTAALLLARGADPAALLTADGGTLRAWLEQYPDQRDLAAVGKLLDEHAALQGEPSGAM